MAYHNPYMGVSKNNGAPKSSILIGLEPLFSPSILGVNPPLFLVQHPYKLVVQSLKYPKQPTKHLPNSACHVISIGRAGQAPPPSTTWCRCSYYVVVEPPIRKICVSQIGS